MAQGRSDAADVLNWDYLCEIAELVEKPRNWREGARRFAYRFTSTADIEAQNRMLTDLLINATANQSVDAAEDVVEALADSLGTPHTLLRDYAKQIGVRLKRVAGEAE